MAGSDGKESAYSAGDTVQSPGRVDPLEKEMAIHSSILAWRVPWTEEPGRRTIHGVTKSQTWLSNQCSVQCTETLNSLTQWLAFILLGGREGRLWLTTTFILNSKHKNDDLIDTNSPSLKTINWQWSINSMNILLWYSKYIQIHKTGSHYDNYIKTRGY